MEDFHGRIEGTLQALQDKGAKQAEDLEKIARNLEGRSQQFQEQADAAVSRLREELKDSGRVVEESKQQLAGLAEAKLAALSQAAHEEFGRQLAQASREHAQVMHEAADVQVQSIKMAAEQAIAQLKVVEQERETGFLARAGAAEDRVMGASSALEALEGRVGTLVEDFRGRIESTLQALQEKGAKQAKDLEEIAQDLEGRWSRQFQEQGDAAVKRLREELKDSGRVVEESKQQLAGLAKARLAALSQIADHAAAGLEAEQRRLRKPVRELSKRTRGPLREGLDKTAFPESCKVEKGSCTDSAGGRDLPCSNRPSFGRISLQNHCDAIAA